MTTGALASPLPRSTIVKAGVVIVLLLLEAATGYLGVMVPAILLAMAGGVLVLRRIEFGIVALVLAAAALRLRVDTGTQSPLVASLMLAAALVAVWLAQMAMRKDLRLLPSPVNAPILCFAAASILSLAWGRAFLHPLVTMWPGFPHAQWGALAVILLSIGVLFVVAEGVRQERWVRIICWLFLLIGVAAAVLFFVQGLPVRLNTHGLFPMWLVALAGGQAFFNDRLPKLYRFLLLALIAFWLYKTAFVGLLWISGWLPALVALVCVSFFRSWRLGALVALLITGYVVLEWTYLYEGVFVASEEEGDFLRLDLWRQNLEITGQSALLGLGPAGYAIYNMTFFRNQGMSTHSNYLDIFSQTGIVGSAIFVWFLGALIFVGWRSARVHRRGFIGGMANGLLAGCLGAIVAMGLGDWVIPFVYNQGIAGFDYTVHTWIMFGLLVAISRFRAKPTEEAAKAPC